MALVLLPGIALSSMAAKDIYILADGAVVYSLKYSFSVYYRLTEAVADHKSRITVFIDHSGSTISGIEYSFNSTLIEYGLVTAGPFQLSAYVLPAFIFG